MIRCQKALRLKNSITFVTGGRRLASGHGKEHGHDEHGHDDHHDHEPFHVPHYSKFNNWEVAPELVNHQQRLHIIGLHDPWIRNYAWIYHPEFRKHWGYEKRMRAIFGGFKYGLVVAVTSILINEGYNHYYKDESHEHH